MWDTVVDTYGDNPRVYFEPMNEPFGYSLEEWVSLTSSWLTRHSDVRRSRFVISGTGYNDNVTGVGAAPELKGTLLSLHFYGFWADHTTEEEWHANLRPRIGDYGWRTIIDEAGSPMTIGLNYGNHEGNVSTSYLGALTETAREQGMGIVYWPGLRDGDSYSMTTLVGDGDLEVNSTSGLAQLQWGWRLLKKEPLNDLPPAPPGEELRGVASGRCIDVPGFSTTNGTELDLWDCNGGGNQSWNWTADKQLTVYGNKCMTIGGDGSSAGSPVMITDCTGMTNQAWEAQRRLVGHQRQRPRTLPGSRRRRSGQRHADPRRTLQRRHQPAVGPLVAERSRGSGRCGRSGRWLGIRLRTGCPQPGQLSGPCCCSRRSPFVGAWRVVPFGTDFLDKACLWAYFRWLTDDRPYSGHGYARLPGAPDDQRPG